MVHYSYADDVLNSILSPSNKNLSDEYEYFMRNISRAINMDNKYSQEVKFINSIKYYVDKFKSENNKVALNKYLLQVLPHLSNMYERVKHLCNNAA